MKSKYHCTKKSDMNCPTCPWCKTYKNGAYCTWVGKPLNKFEAKKENKDDT